MTYFIELYRGGVLLESPVFLDLFLENAKRLASRRALSERADFVRLLDRSGIEIWCEYPNG
jgi:hypothetical protein